MINCSSCNTDNLLDSNFCRVCGLSIREHASQIFCAASGKSLTTKETFFRCLQCNQHYQRKYSYKGKPICCQCAFRNGTAQRHQRELQQKKKTTGSHWLEPVTKMEFIWVAGGIYLMGDVWYDGTEDEVAEHWIEVPGFWMGIYPVTQSQYKQIIGINPSCFQGNQRPVDSVSWLEAVSFAEQLGELSQVKFRLPFESEWEYAASSRGKFRKMPIPRIKNKRLICIMPGYSLNFNDGWRKDRWAGTSDIDELNDYAWSGISSRGRPHSVGKLQPNELGLHDMCGNIWEWCQDIWGFCGKREDHEESLRENKCHSGRRVVRGGCWDDLPYACRVSNRQSFEERRKYSVCGFRLIAEPTDILEKEEIAVI